MADLQTMRRTEVNVNGTVYFLAQDQDVDQLKRRIEAAAHDGGNFVDFTVVGNRTVSVLISLGTSVVVAVQTVQFDARDTGNLDDPFGGDFDF